MEELSRLRELAVIKANRSGYTDLAEDFAQEAILKLSMGRKANMGQLLVDFIRQEYGDTRGGTERGIEWAEKRSYEDVSIRQFPDAMFKDDMDFYSLVSGLDGMERAYILLTHKWGLTLAEIGDCFNLSEGRISQQLSVIHEKIRKKLNRTAIENV